MAQRLKVTYQDGRVVEVLASPRAQVMTEQYCGGLFPEKRVVGTFYLGWASLNKAGKEALDFETWLDLVEKVEEVEVKQDPTEPDQSGDTSST